MADNYLENKYQALQERKAKEQKARQAAWKKRMDAYRKSFRNRPKTSLSRQNKSGWSLSGQPDIVLRKFRISSD